MQKRRLDVPSPTAQAGGLAVYQKFYPDALCQGDMVRVTGDLPRRDGERRLLERIVAGYRHAHETNRQQASGVWSTIETHKRPVHDVAIAGDIDALGAMLREPATTMLFHGFDQPTSRSIANLENPGTLLNYRSFCLGSLRRMAEATGAIPMAYPEGYGVEADVQSNAPLHVDQLVRAIEDRLKYEIRFPNVFLDEIGLDTVRGVASYRAIQSLYQAWRLAAVAAEVGAPGRTPSALEIGGGSGRTAYFAYRAGVRDYSIVDLPMTGLAQAYFLGMALGEDKVCLEGEPPSKDAVKIVSPPALDRRRSYDVAASFDAIVEFSEEVANGYMDLVTRQAGAFLSVNRESKPFTVRAMLETRNIKATRTPYWLRRGYAEEIAILRRTQPDAEGLAPFAERLRRAWRTLTGEER